MKVKIETIASLFPTNNESEIQSLNHKDAVIDSLLTDSRNLTRPDTSLFFAIRTPGGNDGHNYIEELYKKGVRNFIVEYVPPFLSLRKDVNIIVVEDTIKALQKIASGLRNDKIHYVGITGSKGKTTVKEYIYQLLEPLKRISRSPRSYNSQIGLPISLWQTDNEAEIAVLEAGISKKGEMERLRDCLMPETVIFTNISEDHDEGFANQKNKAAEKALLASADSVKNIIYNSDDLLLTEALKPYFKDKNIIGWSFKDSSRQLYLKVEADKDDSGKLFVKWQGKEFTLPVKSVDKVFLENIASSLSFLFLLGIDFEFIKERIGELKDFGTRLNVSEGVNDCILIRDTYISDLSSIRPAIEFMMRRKTNDQKSVIIMGDLTHEHFAKTKAYQDLIDIINECKVDLFIGIGPELFDKGDLFPKNSKFYKSIKDFMFHNSPSDFVDAIILLKGSTDKGFKDIHQMLEARTHETVLEVNLNSLVSNYNYFRSHVPSDTGIVAMVKASGYGAGSFEIAKTMQDCGAAYLAVAFVDEGADLRRNGISMPIMVMNPKVVNYGVLFENRLEPEIFSFPMLHEMIKQSRSRGILNYPVHVKLDTGMHRMGFTEDEVDRLIEILKESPQIRVESLFSHLATADCPDMDDYTMMQLASFEKITSKICKEFDYKVKRHILNSAGILRFPEYHYDMVRLGIGLYGANTLPKEYEKPLEVVSTLRTVIISIREWEKGETIGYGRRGVLDKKSRIATIPIGYADGMNRHFGNGNISVFINGKFAPTVGNICMDACMIDVSEIDCKEGDAVEIFGKDASLQRLADTLDTIPYEVLTSVSPRVRRIYYRE